MAERAPRSAANVVFIVLLAAVLLVGIWSTWNMIGMATNGPG